MKKIPQADYIFAVGKIRVLEKFLIKDEVFEQAIDADLEEALKLFVESDLYSTELLHVLDSKGLETILSKELTQLKSLMAGLIPDKELLAIIEMETLRDAGVFIKDIGSDFLQDYLRHAIDMHNIKTFLRLWALKEPERRLREELLDNGFIGIADFIRLYPGDLAAFLYRLEFVHKHNYIIDYSYDLREAVENIAKEGTFTALEKAIADFLIRILMPAKYMSFGPEAVLAYYFARVNEINLIRLIILAKLNNLNMDLVKERFNCVYA